VRSLGADDVIDYRATRFEDILRDIDVVLDTIGGETRERSWRVLRKGGVLVTLVSAIPADVAEQHSVRGVFFVVSGNRKQLDQITGLVDTGKLKPVFLNLSSWANLIFAVRAVRTQEMIFMSCGRSAKLCGFSITKPNCTA
jgi:NADPH:quinone reductase-like Zn-dependent oxidoreductase